MNRKGALYAALLLLLVSTVVGAQTPALDISSVSVSRPFFNPSLGQKVGLSFVLSRGGSLSVLILDRDGYLVRKLASDQQAAEGSQTFEWDGRDDSGALVPDEAYSLKIDVTGSLGAFSFFPANFIPEEMGPRGAVYDRFSGIVSYKLPAPARVHIQAGSARVDEKTGRAEGPVLKTIANREPRTGGSVVESWNGWDESGAVRVSDLPNFVIAVAATPLPDQSIITVGNRKVSFFDRVRSRSGKSLLTVATTDHTHHRGLQSLDDVAPMLQLKPRNADWSTKDKVWLVNDRVLQIDASVEGPTAATFAAHSGKLMVFLDLKRVVNLPAPSTDPIAVSVQGLAAGTHRITVNWVSDNGPVAVNTVLFRSERPAAARTAAR